MDKDLKVGKIVVFRLRGNEYPRLGEIKEIGHDSVVVDTATETKVCVPEGRIFDVP